MAAFSVYLFSGQENYDSCLLEVKRQKIIDLYVDDRIDRDA